MKLFKLSGILTLVCLLNCNVNAQNEDAEGCKDHSAFNRMTGFHIMGCVTKEFDSYNFSIENNTSENCKKQAVEGKYSELSYGLNEGVPEPSALQIFRNFENALKQINATVVAKVIEPGNSYSFITGKISKGNMETWVYITASGPDYQLYIIEKEFMVQVIQASEMLKALNTSGFIALDILFDTGKSTIKKESMDIVDQVYEMLKMNPSLKVSIEGHTDNTGTPEGNKSLSQSRAKAVMDVLAAKGIDKSRLSSAGWGDEKPVADNRTEEGKAKNRRVEIIKR
jgi:outer membrane protein OmpA-like peptidoglycan-associated protein